MNTEISDALHRPWVAAEAAGLLARTLHLDHATAVTPDEHDPTTQWLAEGAPSCPGIPTSRALVVHRGSPRCAPVGASAPHPTYLDA